MKGQFIGIRHVEGTSQKTGREFSFDVACITSEMSERDINRGARGIDVHTPTVSDRWKEVFSADNLGKEIEVEFYFANGRENIAYAALLPEKSK